VTRRERKSDVSMSKGIREVLDFWFDPAWKAHWFERSAAFDRAVATQLGDLHRRAVRGDLDAWESTAEGCLALSILLDQAPRQLFRGDPRAFATDAKALAVAKRALAAGFDRQLTVDQRQFLYLPLMHSENLADQERCVAIYEADELRHNLHHAVEHADIIRRFGRFPHRNAALGRNSTAEEQAFLREGGNHFGQIMPADAEPDS
jgi:uncharacterized protein (DUF924 family)